MNGNVVTAFAVPVLGALMFLFGLWSLRNIELLVGTLGQEDVLERRRTSMTRGAYALLVAGGVMVAGGAVLAVVVIT